VTDEGLDLYGLVPSLYQLRDAAEPGTPLRRLLQVIQENLTALEADILQLYDDWFIETCANELIPLFAALLDVPLSPQPDVTAADPVAAAGFTDNRRRQVANALADRRRKGTLTALDAVASEATGWPSRTQELRHRVSITSSARHPEAAHSRLINLRDGDRLDRLGTPFSAESALADVRRVTSHRSRGESNPSSVAVVLWRLLVNGADRGEAYCLDDETRFSFDPLGRDVALAVDPQRRTPGTPPASDLDVPTPISRQALHRRLEDYYGSDRSLAIYVGDALVARDRIVAADLSDLHARVGHGQVAVDPVLGRFAFAARPELDRGVTVRYRHLQPAPLGGGSYLRSTTPRQDRVYRVASQGRERHRTVSGALRQWRADRDAGAAPVEAAPRATIEIMDDATYTEHLALRLRAGELLEIRAAPGRRPVLRPVDDDHDRPERLWVEGLTAPTEGPPARITFDGLTIAGHAVALRGSLGEVTFRHCTLVPTQWRGDRERHAAMSLDVQAMPCQVTIANSIVGRIVVASRETGCDPIPLTATDSVLDAAGGATAIEGADGRRAFVALDLQRVTVLGGATVDRVGLIQDCLLAGRLFCEHRQTGEVRYSWIPLLSRTPRRTGCQPDGAIEIVDPRLPPDQRQALREAEIRRITPVFDSIQLPRPGYATLSHGTPDELRRGAHDEGEVGAHHELWSGRRTTDLLIRLAEFTPAGLDCGPLFAT
jgi:hypothetical protein